MAHDHRAYQGNYYKKKVAIPLELQPHIIHAIYALSHTFMDALHLMHPIIQAIYVSS